MNYFSLWCSFKQVIILIETNWTRLICFREFFFSRDPIYFLVINIEIILLIMIESKQEIEQLPSEQVAFSCNKLRSRTFAVHPFLLICADRFHWSVQIKEVSLPIIGLIRETKSNSKSCNTSHQSYLNNGYQQCALFLTDTRPQHTER